MQYHRQGIHQIRSLLSRVIPTDRFAKRMRSGVAMTAAMLMLATGVAKADTIYSESLGTGGDLANFSSIGWSAYQKNGTNWTTGPLPPSIPALAYRASGSALVASSSTVLGTHMALLSDAGTIDPTDSDNDLTISFRENATDDGTPSPAMGWRALAQVGSTIYASDSFSVLSRVHHPRSRRLECYLACMDGRD